MTHEIHPIPAPPGGTVPADAAPYQPPRRRLRKVAAAVAVGLAIGAGGVAVAQLPLHDSQVGSVFSATQNPDEESTAPAPESPEREHAAVGRDAEDDD